MIIENFIPLIPFISVGFSLTIFFNNRFFEKELRITEQFIITLIFGTGVYIIPLVIYVIWEIDFFLEHILIFITTGYFLALYWIYRGIPKIIPKLENFSFVPKDYSQLDRILFFIISFLAISYLIIQLILPERGYDALLLYLPESYTFYQLDTIPVFDYLTFFPVFKSPLITLLFSFPYYVAQGAYFRLIPIMYFFGLFCVAYEIGKEFFNDNTKNLAVVCFTMVMPLTWFFIMTFPYYQDIPLSFFFSCSVLFYLRSIRIPKNSLIYSLLSGLCIALSLLSKINGWPILLILPLLTPVSGKKKNFLLLYLSLLAIMLSIQVSTKYFLLFSLVILLIFIFIGKLIIENKGDISFKNLIPTSLVGFLLGFSWVYGLYIRLPNSFEEILNDYLYFGNTIKFISESLEPLGSRVTFETVQGVDPVSLALFFFVGLSFALGWTLPKIVGLLNYKEIRIALIWLLSFWAIWLTYKGTVSSRYLAPIMIPMSILVVHGIFSTINILKEKFPQLKEKKLSKFVLLYYMATSGFSYHYLIILLPIDPSHSIDPTTGLQYDMYNYMAVVYTLLSPIVLIIGILIGFFPIFILKIYSYLSLRSKNKKGSISEMGKFYRRSKRIYKYTLNLLILIIVIYPIATPAGVLVFTGFDSEQFNAIFADQYRPAFREAVGAIVDQEDPDKAIIVVNIPGVHYFTNQPTIDIYAQRKYAPAFLEYENITHILEVLDSPKEYISSFIDGEIPEIISSLKFSYFVLPTVGHYWFRHYYRMFLWEYPLFRIVKNNNYYSRILMNEEFVVYKAIFEKPIFYGPISFHLGDSIKNGSLMGIRDCKQELNSETSLFLELDYSIKTNTPYNVSFSLEYHNGDFNHSNINKNFEFVDFNKISTLNLLSLGSLDTNLIYMGNVNLTVSYIDKNGILTNDSMILSIENEFPISKTAEDYWFIDYGEGYSVLSEV